MADDARKTVSSTSGGTLYLILIQVASRAFTFAGNQFLFRFLSPQLLGIAVQLELFSVSVLYFSRESLRVALQRQPAQSAEKPKDEDKETKSTKALQSQTIVNVSYLTIALGSVLTLSFGYLWFGQADTEVLQSPYFSTCLLLYGFATFAELLSEPSFVIIQQDLLYKSRARAETWAVILKCMTACCTAVLGQHLEWKPSVLPFAVGQCTYAVSIWAFYLASVSQSTTSEGYSMLLKPIKHSAEYHLSYFSKPLLNLATTLYAQSIFKQFITQGDAFILSFLTTLSDQGAFALASNYGGLIARLIFQPIEESSRNAFGKLLSPTSSRASKPSKSNLDAALSHLTSILHLYSLITLLSFSFLPTLLPLLVRLVVGPTWFTPAIASLLSSYSYCIPFLAYNGILDAFVTSVATPAQLHQKTKWMAIIFCAYCAAAYVTLRVLDLGAQGLVWANIFTMSLRTWRGRGFVKRYFDAQGVEFQTEKMMPRQVTVAVCVGTGALLRAYPPGDTFMGYGGLATLIPVVGICGIGGLSMYVFDSRQLYPFHRLYGKQQLTESSRLFFERHFLMQYLSAVLPERHASRIKAYIS